MKSDKIGKIIRKERDRLGITTEELAHISDISRNHIGQIERGETMPRINTLEKIVNALNMQLEDLFAYIPTDKKPSYLEQMQPFIDGLSQKNFEYILKVVKDYFIHQKNEKQ